MTDDLAREFARLAKAGCQFEPSERRLSPLPGLTFEHPERGTLPLAVPEDAVRRSHIVYADDAVLTEALLDMGLTTLPTDACFIRLRELMRHGTIVGISGYATAGYSYSVQAQLMQAMFERLRRQKVPVILGVDGGGDSGILGLSGVLGEMTGLEMLGVVPRQGLPTMAPRSRILIAGDTYRDREFVIGTIPDVLICLGGGEGTYRELKAAHAAGTSVVVVEPGGHLSPLQRFLQRDPDKCDPVLRAAITRPATQWTLDSQIDKAVDRSYMTSLARRQARITSIQNALAPETSRPMER